MGCPTKEEYKEALKNKEWLEDVVVREAKRREDLIKQLIGSQECLDGYRESLKYQKEIIMKYELYQELSEKYK